METVDHRSALRRRTVFTWPVIADTLIELLKKSARKADICRQQKSSAVVHVRDQLKIGVRKDWRRVDFLSPAIFRVVELNPQKQDCFSTLDRGSITPRTIIRAVASLLKIRQMLRSLLCARN
jgi:hypothetical protein